MQIDYDIKADEVTLKLTVQEALDIREINSLARISVGLGAAVPTSLKIQSLFTDLVMDSKDKMGCYKC